MEPPPRLLTTPFVLAVVAEFGVLLTIGMLLPILPLYAEGPLDVGSAGVGVAVAAASPTALFQPLAGRLGDRRGRKVLVVSGAVVVAGSVAAYTVADSLELLVALRLVTGVGEALMFVGAATIVVDLAPETRRGEALSLYSLGLWGGLAIGPFLGELVLGDNRYDAVWVAAAGCSAAAALIALALPETRPANTTAAARSPRLVHPAAVGPGLVLVASVVGFAGFNAFVALYARDLGLSGAGALFLLFSGIVVGIRIFGRRIPDRIGAKKASGSALVLLFVGLLTIGTWNVPVGLFVGTAIFAAGQALAFPALMTIAVAATPPAERSSVVGTFSAFADVGFAVGALGLGGVAAAAGYEAVFVVGALSSVAGALLLARIPTAAPRVRHAEAA